MGKVMRNEIFSMVKMNYFEWQIMKKKLSLLSESEKLLAYIIQSAEINYTYGMEKLNAYYKSKAMLGDVQSMRLMIEFEISQKKIALNTLMNRDPGSVFEVDTLFTLKDYDLEPADTSRLSTGRSDLRTIDRNIQVMRARQGLERSKLRPDFGLKYDHMIAFGRQPQQFSLMGMMTIPIAPWSSKMNRSSVEGLGLEIESLHYERQAILSNAGGALQSYREQIRIRKRQLELYEKSILPDMLRNYQTSLIAYEQNNEELFMTLDAWQNLNLARLAYLDLLNGLLQLQVNYEKESEIR
jgi:outer membrane protein, heavy metal efflux system